MNEPFGSLIDSRIDREIFDELFEELDCFFAKIGSLVGRLVVAVNYAIVIEKSDRETTSELDIFGDCIFQSSWNELKFK